MKDLSVPFSNTPPIVSQINLGGINVCSSQEKKKPDLVFRQQECDDLCVDYLFRKHAAYFYATEEIATSDIFLWIAQWNAMVNNFINIQPYATFDGVFNGVRERMLKSAPFFLNENLDLSTDESSDRCFTDFCMSAEWIASKDLGVAASLLESFVNTWNLLQAKKDKKFVSAKYEKVRHLLCLIHDASLTTIH